jgi:hypothetical protein
VPHGVSSDNQRFANDLPMPSVLINSNTYTDWDFSKDGTIGKLVQLYVCYRAHLPTTETHAATMRAMVGSAFVAFTNSAALYSQPRVASVRC